MQSSVSGSQRSFILRNLSLPPGGLTVKSNCRRGPQCRLVRATQQPCKTCPSTGCLTPQTRQVPHSKAGPCAHASCSIWPALPHSLQTMLFQGSKSFQTLSHPLRIPTLFLETIFHQDNYRSTSEIIFLLICLTPYKQERYILLSAVSPTLNKCVGLSRSSGNTYF